MQRANPRNVHTPAGSEEQEAQAPRPYVFRPFFWAATACVVGLFLFAWWKQGTVLAGLIVLGSVYLFHTMLNICIDIISWANWQRVLRMNRNVKHQKKV